VQNGKVNFIKSQAISLGFFICVIRDAHAIGTDRLADVIDIHSARPAYALNDEINFFLTSSAGIVSRLCSLSTELMGKIVAVVGGFLLYHPLGLLFRAIVMSGGIVKEDLHFSNQLSTRNHSC
jgi:hypothetical protein